MPNGEGACSPSTYYYGAGTQKLRSGPRSIRPYIIPQLVSPLAEATLRGRGYLEGHYSGSEGLSFWCFFTRLERIAACMSTLFISTRMGCPLGRSKRARNFLGSVMSRASWRATGSVAPSDTSLSMKFANIVGLCKRVGIWGSSPRTSSPGVVVAVSPTILFMAVARASCASTFAIPLLHLWRYSFQPAAPAPTIAWSRFVFTSLRAFRATSWFGLIPALAASFVMVSFRVSWLE